MAVTSHQPHRVFLKAKWDDEWESQSDDGLYCDWCKFACSPDVNEAQLTRTFGPGIIRAGTLVSVHANPLDIEGQYVKVEIAQDALGFFTSVKTWYGIVVATSEERWGRTSLNGELGRQVWQCRGLEYLLQREIIDTSTVEDGEETREINRGIGFNLGGGQPEDHRRIGNRSDDMLGAAYAFIDTIGDAPYTDGDESLWSAGDIVDYLLHRHSPQDRIDIPPIIWVLDASTGNALESFFPTQQTHGKSVKAVLDELIDRRRLLAWYTEILTVGEGEESFEAVKITIATFNKTDIVLPSGDTLDANPTQANWFTDDEGLIVNFETVKDDSSHFNQVIARGEPLGTCFTLNEEDGNFDKDWSTDLQDEYRTAATGAAGYSDLDEWGQMNANQSYRNTDKFIKVWRYFRVPTIWDGQASNREVFKNPDEDPEEGMEVWFPGLRFKNQLPLITEVDYTTVTAVTSEMLENSKPEYRRPFAVIYDLDADRYYHLDKMSYGEAWDDDLKTNGRSWSAHLRMQDDAFGVIIDVSGAPQHVIAGAAFTPIDTADENDMLEAMDWEKISCTVFCEFDGFAEAKYPEDVDDVEDDVIKRSIVRVPNARLDYLCPETVIGINNEGALIRSTVGGYVRDDREKLKDIARTSYEWYSTPRRSVNATIRTLITNISLGDMVLNVGSVNTQVVSNSVVTMMRFDILNNALTVQTQFAQLDVTAF